MQGRTKLIVALAGLTLLTGCKRDSAAPTGLAGASCYPAEAAQWIAEASSRGGGPESDPGGPLSIYLDGSASMVGFIRGARADVRPLADLIGMLPTLNGISHSKTELFRFDRNITAISSQNLQGMQKESGYLCPAGNRNCDAQESHIDQALAKIADADTAGLSVLVSDLWLANSSVLTTDGVALSAPLQKIFSSGRSVAIYGFESPYAGKVSDLPSGKTGATASQRYLFVVVVGPLKRLQAFDAAMRTAPSKSLASDLSTGKAKYALFTLEPAVVANSDLSVFAMPPKGPLKRANFLPVRAGVKIPQFKVDRGQALRQPGAGATWSGSQAVTVVPGAIWEGASVGQTTLFKMVGEKCAPNGGDWRQEGKLEGGWQADTGHFTLDPVSLAALPSGKYLLVGGLRRVSLLSPNPATQWMRDWSFNAANEAEALHRPVMPTLNLSEMARLMEIALLKSAQQKPMSIGGFAVAVEIN